MLSKLKPGSELLSCGAPARLLVKAPNWLGDAVMSLPALWSIRLHFPQLHLGVLVREELASLFSAAPWVDTVVSYRLSAGHQAFASRWKLIRHLQGQRWAIGLLLPRSFESALWLYLARIPVRIGVAAQGRSLLLTHALQVDLKRPDCHLTDSYLQLAAESFGCPPPPSPPPISVPTIGEKFFVSFPYITLAPGAAYGPAKQWPIEYWRALARQLTANGLRVVLVGTKPERPLCEEIAAPLRPASYVFAGETTLTELVSLLASSLGFVGNDSGATHLAAFLGVPTVALFGSTNPVRTAPRGNRCQVLYDPPPCSPCLRRACRFGHYDCLRRITPALVFATLQRLAHLAPA